MSRQTTRQASCIKEIPFESISSSLLLMKLCFPAKIDWYERQKLVNVSSRTLLSLKLEMGATVEVLEMAIKGLLLELLDCIDDVSRSSISGEVLALCRPGSSRKSFSST